MPSWKTVAVGVACGLIAVFIVNNVPSVAKAVAPRKTA
jgi:hypothetical protein